MRLLEKYFQQRRDVGENGFWVDNMKDDKIKELEKLNKKILKCRACPLGNHRLNSCPGNGSYDSKIMFVGEGPGYDEDHRGEVFVGRAGQLLDRILENAMDLNRRTVYITNIVKCHPMKNPNDPEKRGNDRPPTESEAQTCMSLYLMNQIRLIKPKIIVALGAPAAKTLLKSDKGIIHLRGKVFDMEGVKIIPTYHPSYLLRYPDRKKETFQDTKLIRSLL
jgi:DNA polymerase